MDVCLRVLKESNKRSFDSYSVWNSVLIISHITFQDRRMHIFADNLSRNSCIRKRQMISIDRIVPSSFSHWRKREGKEIRESLGARLSHHLIFGVFYPHWYHSNCMERMCCPLIRVGEQRPNIKERS